MEGQVWSLKGTVLIFKREDWYLLVYLMYLNIDFYFPLHVKSQLMDEIAWLQIMFLLELSDQNLLPALYNLTKIQLHVILRKGIND